MVQQAEWKSFEDACLGEKDASKQGRIDEIDAVKDIYSVNVHHDEDMFGVNDLEGSEVFVESEGVVKSAEERINMVEDISAAATTVTTVDISAADELTLAQALAELKSARLPTQGISFKDPSEATTTTITTTTTTPAAPKPPHDKGKGIMIEEPVVEKEKPMKKQEQMRIDEELAFKLQAKEEEVERLTRVKAQQIKEADVAWDDIKAKIEANEELAVRLQAEEQEQFTDAEKVKLFCEFLEQRRKFFAAKRADAKRNKPPSQAQERKLYCTYLQNMEGYTLKQLKGIKFKDIQKMFDRAFKRVNTFIEYKTELLEESLKKAEVEKEKAEVDDDKESAELRQYLEVIPDDGDDVTVDATPLSIKVPINFDREDLEVLWRIVKARFEKTKPEDYMDTLYPLTNHTLSHMFNDVKLQVDYECEMAYELLRLVKRQLEEGYVPE
ncbi:hypothetical protein Tco_1414585 [Tanacetum coccineum]